MRHPSKTTQTVKKDTAESQVAKDDVRGHIDALYESIYRHSYKAVESDVQGKNPRTRVGKRRGKAKNVRAHTKAA